jgi:hypothetical protein
VTAQDQSVHGSVVASELYLLAGLPECMLVATLHRPSVIADELRWCGWKLRFGGAAELLPNIYGRHCCPPCRSQTECEQPSIRLGWALHAHQVVGPN